MNVDESDYVNLDLDYPETETPVEDSKIYTKQTLLHSPLFNNIFPQFNVSLRKKIRNIRNLSLQDDNDQYMALQEEDSQFGVFSDDEILLDMDQDSDLEGHERADTSSSQRHHHGSDRLVSIEVIVKNSSLLVNDLQFPFSSPIRTSCLIKGIRSGDTHGEDSLLVSLKSGFLLLIRIFYVPYTFNDADYSGTANDKMVFKPFVVQWWDTSSSLLTPAITSTGYALTAHSSGLSVVSSSASNAFRIHNCNYSEVGVLFQPHYTVPVNGTILHTCFAQPIKGSILDNHVIFLNMVYTTNRRLELNLYSWTTSEPLSESLTKTILPLNGSFPLPVFIISLSNNGSFLFVTPTELIIITVHDITSAEYNFRRHELNIAFPTNYYCPESGISGNCDESMDEVLISTDNGTIYLIIITNSTLVSVKPVVRISDPISIFSLEAQGRDSNGYELIYGSSMGLNRKLLIDEFLPDVYDKSLPYSQSLLLKNYKNWAPMLDVHIIDSFKSKSTCQNSKQELWCITGSGKRARLSQLRNGYLISRISDPYQSLRKVESMNWLSIHGHHYIMCSLQFETMFLEFERSYQEDEEEEEEDGEEGLVQVEEAAIIYDSPTIVMKMINDQLALQVTPNAIVLTSIEKILVSKSFDDDTILFSDVAGQLILLVTLKTDSSSACVVELIKINDESLSTDMIEMDSVFEVLCSIEAEYQISLAKAFISNETVYFFIGGFDGTFQLLKLDENHNFCKLQEISLNDYIERENSLAVTETDFLVPNDVILTNDKSTALLGTKDGYVFYFKFHSKSLQFDKYFKLSNTNVEFHLHASYNNNIIFVACKSLWLIDFSKPDFPEPVIFDEKSDKAIKTICPIQRDNFEKDLVLSPVKALTSSILLVRDEGLSIANVSTIKCPSVRQINVGESAKKFVYLLHISLFAVLSDSKDPNARLRYVDRKSYKLLSHAEFNNKNKQYDSRAAIFSADEIPICANLWSLDKLGRSKKLLVGCSNQSGVKRTGVFKILDIVKSTGKDDKPLVRVTNLHSFEHADPITSIEEINGTILFSSGQNIYSTKYNIDEKRLKPVDHLLTVPSEITSISVRDDKIVSISTKLDSIYEFEFSTDNDNNKEYLQLLATDLSAKLITNHAILDSKIVVADKVHSNITVMDRDASNLVAGTKFKTVGVPRVFEANFDSFWIDNLSCSKCKSRKDKVSSGILAVSVDGEVIFFKPVSSNSVIYDDLKEHVPMRPNLETGNMEISMDRWDVTFSDKVTGKGLKSINKPYFRNSANKVGLIDYDLYEVSRHCHSYNSL